MRERKGDPVSTLISMQRFRPSRQAQIATVLALSVAAAAILLLMRPFGSTVPLGPQRSVKTINSKMGVHTRLTDEVEPWKIQRTLQMVRQMGANWIVEFFPWAYYHAKDGGFAWQHPDLVVDHANAQGLKVIARLGLTPSWARPPDTPLTYLDEEGYKDFAVYASAFAERYCDRVHYIIVGNEPNLSYEWGYRKTSASQYVDLLRTIYPAVKSSCPKIGVLAGALAPNLEPEDSPWATGDLRYLQQMYDAGAADFFDGIIVLDTFSMLDFLILFFLMYFVYSLFFLYLTASNQTIGMMITELRVAGIEEKRPSFHKLARRCFWHLVSLLFLGIGLLWGVFDRDNMCLHDRLSNTRVIRN